MKKFLIILLLCLTLGGCAPAEHADIAATTLPVWQFTSRLTVGTDLTVTRLVTEEVSCLHDYTLTVRQMKAIEEADVVILSGAGLEEFLDDALESAGKVIDSSAGIELLTGEHHHHHEGEEVESHEGHHHETDPHIWLSPENAMVMAKNICAGLKAQYPDHANTFENNLSSLLAQLQELGYEFEIDHAEDEAHTCVRFVTSWATPETAVDQFLKDLASCQ